MQIVMLYTIVPYSYIIYRGLRIGPRPAARSAHLSALAMARKPRPAATKNGWPEPVSGQNVELLGSLESPEDVDADRGQQR
jgi:hypothetical protein